MYDLLKATSTTNNWVFQYSRRDFSNLFDEVEQPNMPHIFLDPVQIDTTFDEYNTVNSTQYNGSFMVLMSSDIDEVDYDYKYQNHIKPIITNTLGIIKEAIQCDGEKTIQLWREIEIINALDYNFDGVVVTYTINE